MEARFRLKGSSVWQHLQLRKAGGIQVRRLRGLPSTSSVEVKCKIIKTPASLLEKARGQMRKDAAKLFDPLRFSERVVVLVEFAGASLDDGWRIIRIVKMSVAGWKSLRGWPGASAVATASDVQAPAVVASGGVQRKRARAPASGSSIRSMASGNKYVCLDGREYVTLPWHLGRSAVKSERQKANERASSARVDLRNGCWNALASNWGQELLDAGALPRFRQHHWVQAKCGALEVRLISGQQRPETKKFLWDLAELERCNFRKEAIQPRA